MSLHYSCAPWLIHWLTGLAQTCFDSVFSSIMAVPTLYWRSVVFPQHLPRGTRSALLMFVAAALSWADLPRWMYLALELFSIYSLISRGYLKNRIKVHKFRWPALDPHWHLDHHLFFMHHVLDGFVDVRLVKPLWITCVTALWPLSPIHNPPRLFLHWGCEHTVTRLWGKHWGL